MEVLNKTKDFLDHTCSQGHDDEIAEGMDVALVKQLVMLVFKMSRLRCNPNRGWPSQIDGEESLEGLIEEVCIALEAMEMVYRGSDPTVGESFRKIGQDLMHVIINVIDEELNRRVCENRPIEPIDITNSKAFKPIKEEEEESQELDTGKKNEDEETEGGGGNDEKQEKESTIQEEKNAKQTKEEGVTEERGNNEAGSQQSSVEAAKERQEDEVMATDDASVNEMQRPITPLFINKGSAQGNFLIQKATKVLGHFARVGNATQPMAYFPGLINCMLNLINYQPHDSIPWEARLSALWILANLACNPDNMQMMMCTPGLVRSLVRVGCRALHPDDPMEVTMEVLRSRALSSRALLNLSWKPENKISLSENYALVELLTQLAVHRKPPALTRSKTVRDILLQTRGHAVGALRNLAAAPRRTKMQLCEYKNGHVLDALTDVALNESDPGVVNRAFAAIHNLAIHDTAEKMVERPALVLALKDVLLEDDPVDAGGSPIHKEGSPKAHASATLLVLERTITPDMESYNNLRDLLDAINPTVANEGEEGSPDDVAGAVEV